MSDFLPGALVVYRGKGAVVTGADGDKIGIRADGGSTKSVRPKDIEFLHKGPVSSLPVATLENPDISGMLELMEGEKLSFAEFTELLFGKDSPQAAWSAYQLLNGNTFTGSVADGVKARPADEIAAALAAEQAKTAAKEQREVLLNRIRKGELQPEDHAALIPVEQVAKGKIPACKILSDLGIEASPEKAHKLLIQLGVWDYLVNPWPERAGVDTSDPEMQIPPLPDEERVDFTHMTALAIDNEGSEDPDDAVSFADGLLWVHVADPAAVVTPDSELDSEARQRGTNLYLPDGITHMLPRTATAVFGLGLNETSPALSFGIRISDSGEAELEKMVRSTIKVDRHTYGNVRGLWDASPLIEIRDALSRFRSKREADGAKFIDLPEVDIRIKGGQVEITPVGMSPERELVANSMIAAGAAIGSWAEKNSIPMPFSTQSEWEEKDFSKSIVGMYEMRKSSPLANTSSLPGPHSGLGLKYYVRVTSPLRRYCDLLAHQQIRRHLAGVELFTSDEIDSKLAVSEAESKTRRKLERQVDEYWTMVYLLQNPDWTGEAVLVNRQDDRLTFLIPSLAYEFKNRFGGNISLGETVKVRAQGVFPAELRASMRIE